MEDKHASKAEPPDQSDSEKIEGMAEFLRELSSTGYELADMIEYLIQHRELIRDVELQKLEEDAQALLQNLETNKRKAVLEELRCFKDILALHRELIEDYDKPPDCAFR